MLLSVLLPMSSPLQRKGQIYCEISNLKGILRRKKTVKSKVLMSF